MPKKRNLSKSAAALFQNEKRIELAFSAETIFGVVAKKLGNGSFHVNRSLGNGKGYVALATPRGLFTRGSMCIEVGHVVILEGVERLDGDRRAPLPMEIVARIDGKAVLEQFKKKGVLTSADYNYILATSASAGAISSEEQAIAEDDIFEAEEEDADWEQGIAELKQSSKAQRKEEETMRSIAARVGSLKSSKKGLGGSAIIGDASKPLVVEDEPQQEDEEEDYAAFLRSSKLPHAAESLKAAESADTSDLDAIIAAQKRRLGQIEAARDASLMAAEAAAAKVAMAAKSKRVLANWDDEEIAIEDL
jgi:hypothetical protein